MDYETIYAPNPADDVPYTPDRPVLLLDTVGRLHDDFRSLSHENMIRTLIAIGWKCVERLPDGSGWAEKEFQP